MPASFFRPALAVLSAGTALASGPTVVFSNSNGISFGVSGNTITATVVAGAAAGVAAIGAGSQTATSGTVVFANSNGLTFGLSGSTQITGSYTVPTVTNSSATISAGTQSGTLANLVFSNSNGVTFGLNAGTITGSYTVPSLAGLLSAVNVSAGTTSQNLSAVVYSNSNNVSFGLNGSTVTGSASFPAQTAFVLSNSNNVSFGTNGSTVTASASYSQSTAPGALAAGTQTATSGTMVFANSNGISFGMSGSTQITASYTVPSTAGHISAVNVSAGTTSQNLTNVVFSNSNALSFGLNGSTITGSYTVPSIAGLISAVNLSAGTTSQNLTAFVASNSNNVSFGLNGSTLTASASYSQSTAPSAIAVPGVTVTSGTVVFSNSNGVTFGMNGNTITVTVVPGAAAGIAAIQGGTQTATSGTVVFSNSNGVSFGLSGSTQMTASIAAQTAQTVGFYALGNTTQNSSTTLDARTVSLNGLGIITVGYSNGSVQLSATQSAQTAGWYALGNTTQNSSTTLDARTLSLNGLGGITVGYSNGSIQLSGVTTAGHISAVNLSAGTTSNNLTAFVFSNSNNVSFGLNGSTVTATISVPAQTVQTVGLYGVGNTTQNSSTTLDARTISFDGLGAASVGFSNGSVQISVPAVVAQTVQTIGLYGLGNTTQNSSTTLDARTLSFNGLGGMTVGYSNGSIQLSAVTTNGHISGVNLSAGTTSNNLTAFVFSNSNNVSFGLNGSTVTATISVPAQTVQTVGFYAVGNTTQNSSTTLDARTVSFDGLGAASIGYSNGSIQISVPAVVAQTVQTVGFYAVGNTTQNSSTTLDARTVSFDGLGAATVGYSNGSIQISVPVQTAQTQSNIQAIYDGANSISTGTIRFTNANGVSFSVNGQTISASIASRRVSILPNIDNPWGQTNFTISNASFSLQPFVAKADITATQANFLMALSGNTNSSGALTISMGAYTMNGSTLSLASSDSRQITWTSGSQTTAASLYGGVSGTQYRTVALASWNMSGGQEYMLGVWYRTTNDGTWRVWGQQGPTIVNGLDTNETSHYMAGFSTSSYSTAMIASLNITGTNFVRTGADALKQPSMMFLGTY